MVLSTNATVAVVGIVHMPVAVFADALGKQARNASAAASATTERQQHKQLEQSMQRVGIEAVWLGRTDAVRRKSWRLLVARRASAALFV